MVWRLLSGLLRLYHPYIHTTALHDQQLFIDDMHTDDLRRLHQHLRPNVWRLLPGLLWLHHT